MTLIQRPKKIQTAATTDSIGFWSAFAFWLQLGFISFGGPAGQIAILHRELVEKRLWMSERRFLHALNYCLVLPGPEAQQLATYLGWLMHGTLGGIVAGTLFVLPSLLILLALSSLYLTFGELPLWAGLFAGIKPAVTAIVLQAAHRMGSRGLKTPWLWVLSLASFMATSFLSVSFPLIIGTAAAIGWIARRFLPHPASPVTGPNTMEKNDGRALIDDNTPIPVHAQFLWIRLFRVLLTGGLLWLGSMAGLVVYFGWAHTLTQMGWFFTKAALLTFGGAYAVLPYVCQGAVDHYGWLTSEQMMDGLALGETTPGPLIMIVAFVGFVGGAFKAVFGPEATFLAGTVAAVVATWFTFLPSFLFILAGGPLVESSRDDLRFSAPLTAITAAVVGVILHLALYLGHQVLWPQGLSGGLDGVAATLTLLAVLALLPFKWGVIPVIIVSAGLGLILKSTHLW